MVALVGMLKQQLLSGANRLLLPEDLLMIVAIEVAVAVNTDLETMEVAIKEEVIEMIEVAMEIDITTEVVDTTEIIIVHSKDQTVRDHIKASKEMSNLDRYLLHKEWYPWMR